MKKNKSRRGILMLVSGIVLLVMAGGWCVVNISEDRMAGVYADAILKDMSHFSTQDDNLEVSENPVVTVEEKSFCGRVIIEKIGVELPVFQDWSYSKLKKAPCRYSGSVATNDMIVAAHNYNSHFGRLQSMAIDDEIVFVDAVGQSHHFAVKEIVLLDGSAVDDMRSGAWDFTLFTCTKGGKQRVTVRCERVAD